MSSPDELLKISGELQEYGILANDETGGYWICLAGLDFCFSDMSDDFAKAYHAEISSQLAYARANFEIVEVVEVVTRTVKHLQEIDEG